MMRIFILAALLPLVVCAKSNNKGADSPIALGPILKIADDQSFVVIRHDDKERRLSITKKTNVDFVGMTKDAQQLTVGYDVKGKMNGAVARSLKVTQPIGQAKSLGADRTQLTIDQLLAKADENTDGGIDYREMSAWIYRSPKHGPDHFSKADKNGNGLLDVKELGKFMEGVSWWKFSRKPASEWFKLCDKDDNGSVSKKEFALIAGNNHLDNHFKRADKDKNDMLNTSEVSEYLRALVSPR